MKILIASYFLLLTVVCPLEKQNVDLTISVTGMTEIGGTIQIGIYNKKDDFPKVDHEYMVVRSEVVGPNWIHTVSDLPTGEYAIAAYHDVNSDRECNRNFIGIPKELYGFSNNVRPIFRAPSFRRAKFLLDADMTIEIVLK